MKDGRRFYIGVALRAVLKSGRAVDNMAVSINWG